MNGNSKNFQNAQLLELPVLFLQKENLLKIHLKNVLLLNNQKIFHRNSCVAENRFTALNVL